MKVSSKYKRFKRINFTGNTLPLSDTRSSIIRILQGYQSHTNTADLKRLEKEAQIKEIDIPKTDRLLSVSDRAILTLSYDDMLIFDHTLRPGDYVLHGQVNTKPKTYLIIEMEEHFLVFYSYATKYHKLSSMFVPGYRCSNVYINVEKRASMNKDIQ